MHPVAGVQFYPGFAHFFRVAFSPAAFGPQGWGLNPTLDARVSRAHQGMLKSNEEGRTYEPTEWEVKPNAKPITLERNELPSDLAMTGRGTVTVKGFTNFGGQSQQLAVKMYWPEAHHTEENVFIDRARTSGRGDSDITNHLPIVFAAQNFYYTSPIRLAVGLEAGKHRVLRVIAFAHLRPITKLPKHEFVRAWLDCVRCGCHQTPFVSK